MPGLSAGSSGALSSIPLFHLEGTPTLEADEEDALLDMDAIFHRAESSGTQVAQLNMELGEW